ncbi:MAG: peptidylprolyl isomerase [Candidatus Cryptobacteroides sp.]
MKHSILKITLICAAVAASMTMQSCSSCSRQAKGEAEEISDSLKTALEMERKRIEEPEFDIITNLGTMRVRLYPKTPKHRDNFVKLVSEHYYDNLLFHRVIDGFMIQSGDPYTRDTSKVALYGQGGPDYTIPAEFVNEYWHKKGALAAARKGDMANPKKASSGSQFYIVQDENNCLHLDGQYTIFGETIEGLDVIDRIAKVPTDRYDRPLQDVRIITIKPVEPESPESLAGQGSEASAPKDSTKAE